MLEREPIYKLGRDVLRIGRRASISEYQKLMAILEPPGQPLGGLCDCAGVSLNKALQKR